MAHICPMCSTEAHLGTIQCDGCKGWIHYVCTGLPSYALLLYNKTARKYVCSACVHSKYDDYPELIKAIEDHMSDQKKCLKDSQDSSFDELSDEMAYKSDSNETGTDKNQSKNSDKKGTSKRKTKTCKYAIRGTCKNKPDLCNFIHPKMCQKYVKKGNIGCNLGQKCSFFHPKLCHFSVKSEQCIKDFCPFFHLPGSLKKGPDADKAKVGLNHKSPSESIETVKSASPMNGQPSFLDELKEVKTCLIVFQKQQALQQQMLQNLALLVSQTVPAQNQRLTPGSIFSPQAQHILGMMTPQIQT